MAMTARKDQDEDDLTQMMNNHRAGDTRGSHNLSEQEEVGC